MTAMFNLRVDELSDTMSDAASCGRRTSGKLIPNRIFNARLEHSAL
jgi:hypothetical protein